MRRQIKRFIIMNTLVILMAMFNPATVFAASLSVPQISGQVNNTTAIVNYASTDKVAGFEVSTSALEEGTYKVIYTGTKTSLTITRLTIGTPVYVKVRAYTGSGSKKTYSEASTMKLEPALAAVALKGTSAKGVNTLSWTKVSGATSYEISRSDSYSGTYKVISSVNTLSFKDKVGLKTSAYYKVQAYTTVSGVKVYGSYSKIIYLQS